MLATRPKIAEGLEGGVPAVLEARDLSKSFGSVKALEGVTLSLAPGSAVGLIGRNGSGKTTLLRLLAGLSVRSGGYCSLFGVDSESLGAAELGRLGFVDQEARLIAFLSGHQTIDYAQAMQPSWDQSLARRLVAALELPLDQRVGAMSGGTRKRLALLLAMGHRPSLLLLDEPLAGVDPIQRGVIRELLLERQIEDGAALVTSSHDLTEIERGVDRLWCLSAGQLVLDDSLDGLKDRYCEWIVTHPSAALPGHFSEPFVLSTQSSGRRARLLVALAAGAHEEFARRHGVLVEARPLDLETLFPLLTGASIQVPR